MHQLILDFLKRPAAGGATRSAPASPSPAKKKEPKAKASPAASPRGDGKGKGIGDERLEGLLQQVDAQLSDTSTAAVIDQSVEVSGAAARPPESAEDSAGGSTPTGAHKRTGSSSSVVL